MLPRTNVPLSPTPWELSQALSVTCGDSSPGVRAYGRAFYAFYHQGSEASFFFVGKAAVNFVFSLLQFLHLGGIMLY